MNPEQTKRLAEIRERELGVNRRGNAILCFAWGETDRPYAAIATSLEEVKGFIVDQWVGDKDDPFLSDILKQLSEHDWNENDNLEWTFEIGGVRFSDVCVENDHIATLEADRRRVDWLEAQIPSDEFNWSIFPLDCGKVDIHVIRKDNTLGFPNYPTAREAIDAASL